MKRPIVRGSGGLHREARAGDGMLSMPLIKEIATDGDVTLVAADLAGGIVNLSGFTAGHGITTPTAAAILAQYPNMDIGDSVEVIVVSEKAFAATWAAGVDVTLDGRATTPASSHSHCIITKTAATTITWTVL